ncbi:MAG: rod shape-determining protein MreD [Moorellales bacterium]
MFLVRIAALGLVGLGALALGAPADLLLVGTVLEALFGGSRRGALVGVGYGLAQDLLAGTYPGLHALVKGLIGFIIGEARRHFFQEHPLLPALAVLAATLMEGVGHTLAGVLALWGRFPWPPTHLLPEGLVNVVVGLAVYWAFYRPGRP